MHKKRITMYYQRDHALDIREDMRRVSENVKHTFDIWFIGSDENHLIFHGKEL